MTKGIVIVEDRFAKADIRAHVYKALAFLPKDWDFKIFTDFPIRDLNDYNNLLTSKMFWDEVPFDKVLVYQMDAEILRPGIEEFMEYDFIGAPWKFQKHGGNGGLSLRTKERVLEIIHCEPYEGASVHGYEDVYFSNAMQDGCYGSLASREMCQKFSCETIFELGTLGAHAIDKYLTPEQCNQIRTQYDGSSNNR